MNLLKKIFIFLLFYSIINITEAQNIDSLLKILPKQNNKEEIQTLRNIGNTFLQINLDSSEYYLEKALQKDKQNKFKIEKALTYKTIGKLRLYQGNYKDAALNTKKAISIFTKEGDLQNLAISYNNLGIMYEYLEMPDSGYYFYNVALAINFERKDTIEIVETYNNIGTFFYYKASYDSALFYFNKGFKLLDNVESNTTKGAILNNCALIYHTKGDLMSAIDNYIKAHQYYEKTNEIRTINLINNNIGALYFELKFYNKAIEYFTKNIEYNKQTKNIGDLMKSLNNYGNCMSGKGEKDSALVIYKQALEIIDTINMPKTKALLYKNTGDVYLDKKNYKEASIWLYKSLDLRENFKSTSNVISVYISLAEVEFNLENVKLAKRYAEEAEKRASEIEEFEFLINIYLVKAEIYQQEKNYKQSALYYQKYISLNDSLINNDVRKQISELETRYQTERKEHKIKLQEVELEKSNAKTEKAEALNQKRQAQRNIFIIAFILMIIIALIILKNYREKIKINNILKAQKDEIEQKNEELNQQNEEILAQRDEIQSQKDKINIIFTELSHSINYAKRLQAATLPSKSILENTLQDFFVMFTPKDKVSGDFYWWTANENYTIITAADCTGHGVPGALMSMLGISLLRESVIRDYNVNPANILNKIRTEIIKTLKQTGKEGEQKDGMDLSLIYINHRENLLNFAGANNSIYIIKKEKLITENPKIIEISADRSSYFYEIKPDRMPLAIYRKMNRFTSHEIPIDEGDIIYMFSDGFADQFGGPNNAKFKYKPFKNMLLEHASLPMNEQKTIFEKQYNSWKGNCDQIDDVLLLGIKI